MVRWRKNVHSRPFYYPIILISLISCSPTPPEKQLADVVEPTEAFTKVSDLSLKEKENLDVVPPLFLEEGEEVIEENLSLSQAAPQRNEMKYPKALQLAKGTVLKVKKPARRYQAPGGRPYFIKRGDSLSRISEKVYGEWRWWKEIRKNNPKMVRDPNLIFAGFTLFYRPFSKVKREIASAPN